VRIVLILLVVLLALVVLVRWLEPKLAFFPEHGETATPRDFGASYSAATITTSDAGQLHAWLLRAPASRALVVYFHGNGGNLSVWAPILAGLSQRGYDVLAFDYRGYGLSSGTPSESRLYRDAEAVLDYAWSIRNGSQPIVYWGRSLGSAIAAYAATRRAPDGIVIESGFPDARSIVRSDPVLAVLSILASYRFPTAAYLQRAAKPILVIHGDADQIIPFTLGKRLFDSINGDKTFVTIRNGDHNDAQPADPATYWHGVDDFIGRLVARR